MSHDASLHHTTSHYTMQASECQERESQSLLSRLDAAQLAVKQLQSDHRSSAIAMSASNDQRRQVDAEQLRSQLESKYGEHLERVKEQYDGRVDRLQMQLTSLDTQLQSMEGNSALGLRNSHSIAHFTAAATAVPTLNSDPLLQSRSASSAVRVQHTVTESAIAYGEERKEREREKEKEDLERRTRQAEARSIALTQQLQSMPSCLQVHYT